MCVAVDDSGNVVVSGNPTGGAAAWSVAAVGGGGEFRGVSCPTPTFCAAVDTSGQVVTSTNPLGGAGGWAAPVSVDTSDALTAVACPATNLCVAVDLSGNVIAATDPTGGAGQWTLSGVDPSPLLAVSCPTTAACVATDVSGDDVTSTNPAGGSAAWSAPTDIEAATGVSAYAVSCPSTALCFAVSAAGDVSWSTDPLDASPTWRGPYNIAGTHVITGMSCPTLSLCVASSDSGNEVTSIGTSISPAALSVGWGAPTGSFGSGLNAIACSASTKLCLGVGGDTIGSSDAGGGSTAHWFDFGQGSGWGQLQSVSCPSDRFCAAVDDQGQAMTLLDQSATGSQFPLITDGPPSQVDGDNIIHAVSCPSLTLCVAVDDGGNALISTNPSQNQWRVTSVNGGSALNGVSCPSTTLCVAAGDDGRLVALENPATNLTAIGGTYDSGHVLSAISCTPDLCVAVDDAGRTISSTNFGAALPAWTLSTADPGHALSSIACVGAGMCVAGDADGAVVAGALPPPGVTTSAPRSVTSNSADLTGNVMPNAATVTDCHFDYGTTTAYGRSAACSSTPFGSTDVAVTAHVSGLTPNSPLHYRLIAGAAGGVGTGADVQSRTQPLAPTIASRAVSNIQSTTALVSASVNPNGSALSVCRFVYGPSTSYGQTVPCKEKVGALPTAVLVSAAVAGLTSHTTYHFALVAGNGGGQTTGPDSSFRTVTNPVLNLGSRARIVRQTALLQGRCVGSGGTVCSGRVTLSLRVRRRSVAVGSATFHLTAPAAATLRLRLTATAQRRVSAAAHHLLTVSALIASSSGRRTVQLVIGPRA